MLCDECHENEAVYTVHMLVGEETTVRHLCQSCMDQMNAAMAGGNVRHLLSSLLTALGTAPQQKADTPHAQPLKDTVCPQCGMAYSQTRKGKHMGCPACYEAFGQLLEPRLKRLHGAVRHTGRRPLPDSGAQRLRTQREKLSKEMEQAILLEDYELAAQLRDRILSLQQMEEDTANQEAVRL